MADQAHINKAAQAGRKDAEELKRVISTAKTQADWIKAYGLLNDIIARMKSTDPQWAGYSQSGFLPAWYGVQKTFSKEEIIAFYKSAVYMYLQAAYSGTEPCWRAAKSATELLQLHFPNSKLIDEILMHYPTDGAPNSRYNAVTAIAKQEGFGLGIKTPEATAIPAPKPAPKPEVKPAPKPEPKPEVKPAPKPEPKPEVKPAPLPPGPITLNIDVQDLASAEIDLVRSYVKRAEWGAADAKKEWANAEAALKTVYAHISSTDPKYSGYTTAILAEKDFFKLAAQIEFELLKASDNPASYYNNVIVPHMTGASSDFKGVKAETRAKMGVSYTEAIRALPGFSEWEAKFKPAPSKPAPAPTRPTPEPVITTSSNAYFPSTASARNQASRDLSALYNWLKLVNNYSNQSSPYYSLEKANQALAQARKKLDAMNVIIKAGATDPMAKAYADWLQTNKAKGAQISGSETTEVEYSFSELEQIVKDFEAKLK